MKNVQLLCSCFLVFLSQFVLSHNCSFLHLSFLFTQPPLQKWHVGISLCYLIKINPFQSNFSANCILPSSYIPAIFLQAQPREYNARSPVHIKIHGLPWNRKKTTCTICWPKSVLHEEKRRTGSDRGVGATKTCRTSSDIGAEQENQNVGRGPT